MRSALRVCETEPVAVQENHPRVYVHPPLISGRTKVAERIAHPGELGDARLELQTLVARLIRPKKDGTTLQVTDFANRVVRKEVPGVVVGDRHGQPVYARPFLEIAENRVEPLVVKVGGKREHRCLHGTSLYTRSNTIKPEIDPRLPSTP